MAAFWAVEAKTAAAMVSAAVFAEIPLSTGVW